MKYDFKKKEHYCFYERQLECFGKSPKGKLLNKLLSDFIHMRHMRKNGETVKIYKDVLLHWSTYL